MLEIIHVLNFCVGLMSGAAYNINQLQYTCSTCSNIVACASPQKFPVHVC